MVVKVVVVVDVSASIFGLFKFRGVEHSRAIPQPPISYRF